MEKLELVQQTVTRIGRGKGREQRDFPSRMSYCNYLKGFPREEGVDLFWVSLEWSTEAEWWKWHNGRHA